MNSGALLLVLVIIIIFTLYCTRESVESLIGRGTRIFRTTGVYNEANEIQLPPGIVVGTPVFDYTHTYWDGYSHRSCDECPAKEMCPKCPKYQENYSVRYTEDPKSISAGQGFIQDTLNRGIDAVTGRQQVYRPESVYAGFTAGEKADKDKASAGYFNKEGGEHYDMHGIRPINIDWDPLMERMQNDEKMCTGIKLGDNRACVRTHPGDALNLVYESPDVHGISNKPSVDFSSGMPSYLDPDQIDSVMVQEGDDPEFWSGRGKLGGCATKRGCGTTSRYTSDVAYLGTKNDDYFDGERAVKLGLVQRDCDITTSSVKLMQQNRLDRQKTKGSCCDYTTCDNRYSQSIQSEPRTLLGAQGYVYKESGMA